MSTLVTAPALVPRLLHGIGEDPEPHLAVDGTAVVIDIAGFTTLAEQLSAAGREGTEQLIATLSRIYTVLLPSTDDGGDVVKFAGDALVMLFTGEDHARHAAHAAWNMNRVLATIGDIHLPAVRARLRMSVGVHSGTFEVFLTGEDSLSVILTGAETSRVLQLQAAAPAGRILVSDETAAALPAKQVAAVPEVAGAHRLLRAGSVAVTSLMALSAGRGTASDRFLPAAFAERPDLLAAAPDHRWVAIGFIQVLDVPERPDREDLARMQRLTRLVEQACAATGSTLLDVDPAVGGYRYFLTAGAPRTVEDPEGCLITAAVQVVSAATDYQVRAGVSSGRTFAGFVGAPYRQTYTVMGDSTNLAARLTSHAEPGTVLVAQSAVDRSHTAFRCEEHGPVTVKGKSRPIPVAVVTGTGAPGQDHPQVPFAGRQAELARLRGLLDGAARGNGSVLTVTGPAGIGKSRLLAEALRDSPVPVLRADGDRFAAGTPYRTVRSLLRPLLGIGADADQAEAGAQLAEAVATLRADLVPWLPVLAPVVGAVVPVTEASQALDDAFRIERLTALLGELLETLLPEPTCLVIDDAHWVDPASAEVMPGALTGSGRHLVLLCRRDTDSGLQLPGEVSALGGLPDDEAADLVEGVLGRQLLPADLEPIVTRAEGSPLYLHELAAAFTAQADALGIEQLVGERIDALSETDRSTLRRAAVLGTRIPLALYLRLVGPPLLSTGLSGFLTLAVDAVTFHSELFRDVAYAQLSFQARRDLHRAAAAAVVAEPSLAAGSHDAMLTAHYQAAGDWEAARAAARRAAEAAEQAFALEDAVRAYRVAVEAAGKSRATEQEMGELLAALGRVSVASGRVEEGLEAYVAARRRAPAGLQRARLDRERGYALNLLGRPDEAVRALRAARRAVSAAEEHGGSVLASVAVTECGIRLRQANWSEARRLATEAIELLAGQAEADPRTLADAYRYHDIAASELEGDAAMVHLQQALDLYQVAGDELSAAKVLSLIGVRAYYRGDWTTAASLYDQARESLSRAGDVVGAAIASANTAEVLVDQGRVAEAGPQIKAVLRVFAASGNPYLVAFVTGFRGRAELRSGDPVAARASFAEAAEGFRALEETDSLLDVLVRQVEADLELGDLDAARAAAEQLNARDDLHGPALSQLTRHRSRLALLAGDPGVASDLARSAAEQPGATPLDRALALVQLASCPGTEAPELRAEAESLLHGLGVLDLDTLLAPTHPTPAPHHPESVR